MIGEVSYAYWAKSEAEARDMQALGWRVGQSAIVHHNAYAILLIWEGDGEPPVPVSVTLNRGC